MNLDRRGAARVRLRGPFRVSAARTHYARVVAHGSGCELWLRGAALESLAFETASELELTWHATAVSATVWHGTLPTTATLQAAAVHETLSELYAVLPLEHYDAGARAFWRKVFLVVRLPGGARLLRWLANRGRRAG